jgi:hypothetical protein
VEMLKKMSSATQMTDILTRWNYLSRKIFKKSLEKCIILLVL